MSEATPPLSRARSPLQSRLLIETDDKPPSPPRPDPTTPGTCSVGSFGSFEVSPGGDGIGSLTAFKRVAEAGAVDATAKNGSASRTQSAEVSSDSKCLPPLSRSRSHENEVPSGSRRVARGLSLKGVVGTERSRSSQISHRREAVAEPPAQGTDAAPASVSSPIPQQSHNRASDGTRSAQLPSLQREKLPSPPVVPPPAAADSASGGIQEWRRYLREAQSQHILNAAFTDAGNIPAPTLPRGRQHKSVNGRPSKYLSSQPVSPSVPRSRRSGPARPSVRKQESSLPSKATTDGDVPDKFVDKQATAQANTSSQASTDEAKPSSRSSSSSDQSSGCERDKPSKRVCIPISESISLKGSMRRRSLSDSEIVCPTFQQHGQDWGSASQLGSRAGSPGAESHCSRDSTASIGSAFSIVSGCPVVSRRCSMRRRSIECTLVPSEECQSDVERKLAAAVPEWRAHFLDKELDWLADFSESHPADEKGRRTIRWEDLEGWLAQFGLAREAAVSEALAKQLPGANTLSGEVTFKSFVQLLDFMLATSLRSELEFGHYLWSESQLAKIKKAFRQHADSSGKLPSVSVFKFMGELNFLCIDVTQTNQQYFVAEVARLVLAAPGGQSRKTVSGAGVGYLNDLIAIVTRSDRGWRRRLCWFEMELEQEVQREAGFTVSEVEDLRELHRMFVDLEHPSANDFDNFARMQMLLGCCNVPKLSVIEMRSLARIVGDAEGSPKLTSSNAETAKPVGAVPFSVFMGWMKDIFQLKLGGLERSAKPLPSRSELQGIKGFAAAMLREYAYQAEVAATNHRMSLPTSSRTSVVAATSSRASFEAQASRRASKQSASSGERHTTRRRTFSAVVHNALSRSSSRQGSRSGSKRQSILPRSSSRQGSRSGSRRPSVQAVLQSDENGAGGSERDRLVLVGLPPAEALLAHRAGRVCSVDLGKNPPNISNLGPESAISQPDLHGVNCLTASECCAKASAQSGERKVKMAQSSDAVVSSAITRLELLELEQDR